MSDSAFLGGVGSFLSGLSGGLHQRSQRRSAQDQQELDQLRIEAAIEDARERLGMDRERHQQDMEMARDMKLRRSQSPYQLLQSQISPLGPGAEGPLTPQDYDVQQQSQGLLDQMGPFANIPLQDQEILNSVLGFQQEADAAARMQQPLPDYFQQVYPTLPDDVAREDFGALQRGLPSMMDMAKFESDQQEDPWSSSDALSMFTKYNTVRNDALTQGIPVILRNYPEIRAKIAEMSSQSITGAPPPASTIMQLLPYEAIVDLHNYASEQADYFLQQSFGGGMDNEVIDDGEDLFGDMPLDQGEVVEEGPTPQQLNYQDFLMDNPGAENLALYQDPFIQDYIGSYWSPEVDMGNFVGEIRSMMESAGREPGVVPMERSKKKKKTSHNPQPTVQRSRYAGYSE